MEERTVKGEEWGEEEQVINIRQWSKEGRKGGDEATKGEKRPASVKGVLGS